MSEIKFTRKIKNRKELSANSPAAKKGRKPGVGNFRQGTNLFIYRDSYDKFKSLAKLTKIRMNILFEEAVVMLEKKYQVGN